MKLSTEEQNALAMVVRDAVENINNPITVYMKLSLPIEHSAAIRLMDEFTTRVKALGAIRHYCCNPPSENGVINVWPIFFFEQDEVTGVVNDQRFMVRVMNEFRLTLEGEQFDYSRWDGSVPVLGSVSKDPELIIEAIQSVSIGKLDKIEDTLAECLSQPDPTFGIVTLRTSFDISLMHLLKFQSLVSKECFKIKFVVVPGSTRMFNIVVFAPTDVLKPMMEAVSMLWPIFVKKHGDAENYPKEGEDGYMVHPGDDVAGKLLNGLCVKHKVKALLHICNILISKD